MNSLGQWLVVIGLVLVVATGWLGGLALQLLGLGLIVSHPTARGTDGEGPK